MLSSALLYALAQPDRGFWPASLFCLVPLLVAMGGRSGIARMALCVAMANLTALFGTAGAASQGLEAYFELSPSLAILAWLVLAQLLGTLPMLVFALLAGDPADGEAGPAALRVGLAWVSAELVRSTFLSGMPWFLLAYGVANVPMLAQAASIGGVLLVSGLLASSNAAVARLVVGRGRVASRGLLAGLGVGASLALLGAWVPVAREAPSLPVALVQGPIGADPRRGPAEAAREIARMASASAGAREALLVIWPENAANLPLPWNAELLTELLRAAEIPAPHLVIGAPFGANQGLHTSAVLFSPVREVGARHDKVKLVPFGEYTPWPFSAVDTARETRAGARPVVLEAGALRVGPLICYEILFGDLARSLVTDNANVLANLSNDGWFQHPAALEQHLAAGVYRAIEVRRPVLRATRTGITAAIDARGRVMARLPVGVEGLLETQVEPTTGTTPYAAGGFVFPWAASIAAGVVAFRRRFPSRRGHPPVY